ncbi:MAG: sugar phosphate isomerase/epimerase [Gemmataceae bacterium]|nr:sugar phosphate isomerase/epimerase [Gemmataceae bacterium]
MNRPVLLNSGAWTDISLEELAGLTAEWGYQGFELASWGKHLALSPEGNWDSQLQATLDLLARFELSAPVLAIHRISHAVSDRIDPSLSRILPEEIWGDGEAEGVSIRATSWVANACAAAQQMAMSVVSGFTGSPIWHRLTGYPYPTQEELDEAFKLLAEKWHPLLDKFQEAGVKFALEVHAGQMAFDISTAERTLAALDHREDIGFTFDPSQLFWQGIDPVEFLYAFPSRIFHVHIKDIGVRLDGRSGLLNGGLPPGAPRRGWDFRCPGRGQIDWEAIFRALNAIHYEGALAVEISDPGIDRLKAAEEAIAFLKHMMPESTPEIRQP